MANAGLNLPSGSGGLMRYSEEYKSKFQISPSYVVLFIILILVFVGVLKIFYPVVASVTP